MEPVIFAKLVTSIGLSKYKEVKMSKKQKQTYNTVGDVYMELVGCDIDMEILVQLPDGTQHKIQDINTVGTITDGGTMKCVVKIE